MKKFIKKKWIVSKGYKKVDGFNMKPGFLYSIDRETGNLVDIVTSVYDDMEYITVFHKRNDQYERHEYWRENLSKHIMDAVCNYIDEMEDRRVFYPYPSESDCYKMATDFIERKVCPYGTYEEEFQAYTDGTPPVIKVYAKFPSEVKKIIRSKEKEKGFSHWDDHLLLYTDEDAKNEYEERYNPPHCW